MFQTGSPGIEIRRYYEMKIENLFLGQIVLEADEIPVRRPPLSAWDKKLSVRRPLSSLRRTESKKVFRPSSFTVRRPPPSRDGRPRPATPAVSDVA